MNGGSPMAANNTAPMLCPTAAEWLYFVVEKQLLVMGIVLFN
jgi:hypothetical protein